MCSRRTDGVPMAADRTGGTARPAGRRRSPDETRREILDAAQQFLMGQPFRDLNVARLMDMTSVGRSSFYVHFDDLYGLAAALLHTLDEELEAVTRGGRQPPRFPQSLSVTLGSVVDFWERNGPVIRAVAEASVQDERLDDLYRRVFTQRVIERVSEAIEDAQGDGLVDSMMDAREVATLLALMDERYLGDRLGRGDHGDTTAFRTALVMAWERVLQAPTVSA